MKGVAVMETAKDEVVVRLHGVPTDARLRLVSSIVLELWRSDMELLPKTAGKTGIDRALARQKQEGKTK